MITASDYNEKHQDLMVRYEQRVREWLSQDDNYNIANKIPFFRDGVVCPEKWFEEGNDFRPLFILKEVSLGISNIHSEKDGVNELDKYLIEWGNPKYFEFAQNPFDDIRNGHFSQWRRIAKLAKGLEEIHNGADWCDYYKYDFSFKSGGEIYQGDIEGYKQCNEKTANSIYNEIIDRIAVLELKKLGAGTSAGSELSIATKHYTEHIDPFKDLIIEQINLIDPTVIICLGREYGKCTSHLLKDIKPETKDRIWIDGYHHILSSNKNFYEIPLETYKKYRK